MAVLETEGETIHYLKEGNGPVLVLVHSLGANANLWRPQIDAFRDRYTVIAMDTRGHGGSSAKGDVTVEAAASDLAAILSHLDVTSCDLVAISTGGPIALTLAAKHPGLIRKLVLADTYAKPPEGSKELVEATAEAIAYISMVEFGRQYAAETLLWSTSLDLQDELAASIAAIDPKVYVKLMRSALLGDFTAKLGAVKAQTLVLIGSEDTITPPQCSEALVAGIANAVSAVVADAGHLSSIDNPAAFNAALENFVGTAK
jgi:3-oxoadipate enol-lactonase